MSDIIVENDITFLNGMYYGFYKKHAKKWKRCYNCKLGESADKHVIYRGHIPCSILFIGEAPGHDEDMLGVPFIGRSGQLLDKIIARVRGEFPARIRTQLTYGITNTVCCIPLSKEPPNRDGKIPIRKPELQEMIACSPRIPELLKIAEPKAVVFIGKVAQEAQDKHDMYPSLMRLPRYNMLHPSYLIRNGGESDKNIHYKRTVIEFTGFLAQHFYPLNGVTYGKS